MHTNNRYIASNENTVELGYNVMKEAEYFVLLQMSVVITEVCNVMVDSEELIGTTEYLTLCIGSTEDLRLYTRCRISRCGYNRVRLHIHGKRHAVLPICYTDCTLYKF
jgi:hypothetical protein